jgi:uncharacterized protein YqeY
MSLKDRISDDMKVAMRARDAQRLDSIRMLRAAIQRREVDDRVELDDDGVLAVIQKQVKQAQDSIRQFTDGNRLDLVEKEQAGLDVLKSYLPEQLAEAEIDRIISAAIEKAGASEMRDMGKVMGVVKGQLQNRADMGMVSARIKELLQGD